MRNLTFILALLFNGLLFTTCAAPSLSGTEQVTFILPSPPPDSTTLYWEITTKTCGSEQSFTTTAADFKVTVTRNQPFLVLAQPVTELQNHTPVSFYKPAGTIYPYDFEGTAGSQTLTWEGGVSASIMSRLIAGGVEQQFSTEQLNSFISSFNWQKLLDSIAQKCQENLEAVELEPDTKFYNPWLIDTTKLLENLSNHNFSAAYLDTTNLYSAAFDFTLTSSYVPMNQYIKKSSTLTLKKNEPELFLYQNNYGAYLTGTTAKNVSLQWIFMPIINKDL